MAECSKQDETYDSNDLPDDFNDFCENFTFLDSSSCCQCNGFNGPNFDQPLCSTCHKFLFPASKRKRLRDSFEEMSNRHKYLRYNNSIIRVSQLMERSSDFMARSFQSMARSSQPIARSSQSIARSSQSIARSSQSIPRSSQPIARSLSWRAQPKLKDLNKIFGEFIKSQNNNVTMAKNEPEASSSKITHVNDYRSCSYVSMNTVKSTTQISALPVEMLLKIFSFLDDISLIDASKVSIQWNQVLGSQEEMWKTSTKRRWPLFHRKAGMTNWYKMYSSLLSSCFCRKCAVQMMRRSENDKEYLKLHKRAESDGMAHYRVSGIRSVPLSKRLAHWQASIIGPANSPYEGGIFYLYIYLPFNYPFDPPIVKFLTKIIHPNISRHGDIGLDIITWNYCSSLSINPMLLCIQSLLCDPYTKVCMEPELGRLYDHDRQKFDALARKWTKKYAMMEVSDLDRD